MPGAERRKRQENKKSETGCRQNRRNATATTTSAAAVVLPVGSTSTLAEPISVESSTSSASVSTESLDRPQRQQRSPCAQNAYNNHGVAQLIKAAAICEAEESLSSSEIIPRQQYRASVRSGQKPHRRYFTRISPTPPSSSLSNHFLNHSPTAIDSVEFTNSTGNSQQHLTTWQQHINLRDRDNNLETLRLNSGSTDNDNISLNYVVNGHNIPVTIRPTSNGHQIIGENGEISMTNVTIKKDENLNTGSPQYSGRGEITVTNNPPIVSQSQSPATRDVNLHSNVGQVITRKPSLYPCGPEVLVEFQRATTTTSHSHHQQHYGSFENGSSNNEYHSQPSQVNPKLSNIDNTVDLSKLDYLSRLACEVPKLETSNTQSRESVNQQTQNIDQELLQSTPRDSTLAQSDRDGDGRNYNPPLFPAQPFTFPGPRNYQARQGRHQMGVYINNMSNGTATNASSSVRVKEENQLPSEETGDEVLDLRKPNATEKLCIWCGKSSDGGDEGVDPDFCSEVCFDLYRRDSFKKRSNCIWCSGISPSKNNYATLGVIDESRFCSEQCLAQYKVKLFCEETSAHLEQLKDFHQINGSNSSSEMATNGNSQPIQQITTNGDLITEASFMSGQRGRGNNNKTTPSHQISPSHKSASSGCPSPMGSPQSIQSQNSTSPNQLQNVGRSRSSKIRIYTGTTSSNSSGGGGDVANGVVSNSNQILNSAASRHGGSPPSDRERQSHRHSDRSSTSQSQDSQSQPSPRKRMKSTVASTQPKVRITDADVHQLELSKLNIPIQHMPPGSSIGMVNGNASPHHQNHSPTRSRRSNIPAAMGSARSPTEHEIARAIARGNLLGQGPPLPLQIPSMQMIQQHGQINGSAMMTHPGLHTGGLMMASPKLNVPSNNNNQPKSTGYPPRMGMMGPMQHQHNIENAMGKHAVNMFANNGFNNALLASYLANPGALAMINSMNMSILEQNQLNHQRNLSPVTTNSAATQTDPECGTGGRGRVDERDRKCPFLSSLNMVVPFPLAIPLPIPMPFVVMNTVTTNEAEGSPQIPMEKIKKGNNSNPSEENCGNGIATEDTERMAREIASAIATSLKDWNGNTVVSDDDRTPEMEQQLTAEKLDRVEEEAQENSPKSSQAYAKENKVENSFLEDSIDEKNDEPMSTVVLKNQQQHQQQYNNERKKGKRESVPLESEKTDCQ